MSLRNRLLLLFLYLFLFLQGNVIYAQTVIWSEDFEDEANGATTGNDNNLPVGPDWTLTYGGSGIFSKQNAPLVGNSLYARNLDAVGTWVSETIDISGTGLAVIEMDANATASDDDGDYVRAYYRLDGGSRVLFYEINGGVLVTEGPASAILQGSSVVVEVDFYNNDADSFFGIPLNDQYSIDNITVTEITDIYSRASGDWNTSGNWSIAGIGGTDCACIPNTSTIVHIGAGYGITTNADITPAGLEIQSAGQLTIIGANALNINYGSTITIEAGAALTTTDPGSSLNLLSEASYVLNVDGALTIGDLSLNDNQNLSLTGNGAITLQDDLLANGDVDVTNDLTSTFTISDAVTMLANNSMILMNNGTIDIGGSFDGGSFFFGTQNGDFIWTNNGIVNHAGNYTNIDGGSDYINASGSTWNWSGNAADADMSTVFDASAANNTFNYLRSGAQPVLGVTYHNVNFNTSGNKTLSGNIVVNNNLTINGSATLSGTNNIDLAGSWVNNSSYNGTGTVTLNGSYDQTITRSSGETFTGLTINKPGGNVLFASGTDVAVTNLTLTSGYVDIGDQNLTVASGGSITGGSAGSFVVTSSNGVLTRNNIGATDFIFPVGRVSNSYTPVTINNGGTVDNFSVRVCQGVYSGGACESGSLNMSDLVDKTWFISEASVGGSDATLTFQWNGSDELSGFDRSSIEFVHYGGTSWDPIGTSSAAGGGPYTSSVSNVNSFSPFAVGDGDTPLPVELNAFTAQFNGKTVDLKWETASELNNDYFIVERSTDMKVFEEISSMKGHGTTNEQNTYEVEDVNPFAGTNYYRLTQVDFDGTSKTYEPVKVEVPLMGNISAHVFPVPVQEDYFNLQIHGVDKSLEAKIQILNINGKVIHEEEIFVDKDTGFDGKINLGTSLPKGIYILEIKTPNPIIKRLMVK